LKCTYEDKAFEFLSQKILNCGALVLGTPVYWWDTSGLVKYLILKMFRVYARTAPLQGLPAFGLAIAGGTGNGLISGLRPVYHFFHMLQMRALEPVPATRFNFNQALTRAVELGYQIAGMTKNRALGLSLAGERRLLADLVALEAAEEMGSDVLSGLARSDAFTAAGRGVDSLSEATQVYEAGVRAFERK
jgi:multimeric flavodoxin WrbA